MDASFFINRCAVEAKEIARSDGKLDLDGMVAYSERVASLPKSRLSLPVFLRKTASTEQQWELEGILTELWVLNEEYVGERTRDAEVAICHSGRDRPVRDRLMAWCRSYVARRLERPNPKDFGDPFLRFRRICSDELAPIFRPLLVDQPTGSGLGSLDYVIAEECQLYAMWVLYEGTFKNAIKFLPGGEVRIDVRQVQDREVCRNLIGMMLSLNFHRDGLGKFLEAIRRFGESGHDH